jgi:hypothetical protein
MTNKDIKKREYKFNKWWFKARRYQRAQQWLVSHSKRIAFAFNLHPSAFDEINFICRRFNLSTHKKLKKSDARTLFRLCNPLPHERLGMITDEATKLQELINELKQLKRSQIPITKKKTRSYSPPSGK